MFGGRIRSLAATRKLVFNVYTPDAGRGGSVRETEMTGSTATLLSILLGVGVFAIIVAIGWRSVQNRRILRLQDANGHETIIVASEDDEISSVATSIEPRQL